MSDSNTSPPPKLSSVPSSFIIKGGVSAPRLIDDILHMVIGPRYLNNDPVTAASNLDLRRQTPWSIAISGDPRLPEFVTTSSFLEFYSLLFSLDDPVFIHLHAEIELGAAPPENELMDFHLCKPSVESLDSDQETYEYKCSITATHLKLIFHRPVFTKEDWATFHTSAIAKRFQKFKHLSNNSSSVPPMPISCLHTLYKIISKPILDPTPSPIFREHFSVNVRTTPEFLIKHLYFTLKEDDSKLYPPDIYEANSSPELREIRRDYIRKLHEVVIYANTYFPNVSNSQSAMTQSFTLKNSLPILRRLLSDTDPRLPDLSYLKNQSFYGNKTYGSSSILPSRFDLQMYTMLGATHDLSNSAISKRYDLQAFQDPENKPYYFEALLAVAKSRQSEILETKATELLSLGETSASNLAQAYGQYLLNFDKTTTELPLDEDYLIDCYKHRSKEFPEEEPTLRNALLTIANHRNNARILSFLESKSMTLPEAYSELGLTKDSNEEYIHLAYETKMQEARPEEAKLAKLALRTIAIDRKSKMLLNLYETAVKHDHDHGGIDQNMTLSEAITILRIPQELVDEAQTNNASHSLIVQHFEANSGNDPERILEQRQALRVLSKHLKSKKIESYLSGAPDSDFIRNSLWPVGLENIGNTCYLNSLLQFYFTITPLRNAVIDFCDNSTNQIDLAHAKEKRVGGRVVTKGEIVRSRQFVCYLGELFKQLIHTPLASIAPKKELAFLALVPSQIDPRMEEYESLVKTTEIDLNAKLTTSTQGTVVDSSILGLSKAISRSDPIYEDDEKLLSDDDESITAESEKGGTVIVHDMDDGSSVKCFFMADELPKVSSDDDVVMVDDVSTDSSESPKRSREALSPKFDSSARKRDRKSIDSTSTSAGNEYSSIDRKESIVTVRSIDPPKTSEQKRQMDDAMAIGGQQDVTECIENVLFQIEGAFDALGYDEDGEQLDMVKELFYGATKQLIEDPETGKVGDSKTERFSMLIVNVEDKPQNMYEVIDTYFDDSLVELGKKQVIRHITATKLPPVLQVQIQRVQFDKVTQRAYKSKAPIRLLDTIYLDRYMDSDEPIMVAKRKELKQWKARISKLRKEEDEINDLVGNGITIIEALESTKTFLVAQNAAAAEGKEALAQVSPQTVEFLEKHVIQLKYKLESIRAEIADLENKLVHQFDDMHHVGYKLHSVFIHRGQATFGHYWVHIHDFRSNIYRMYNDKTVAEVSADEVMGIPPPGSTVLKDADATAYYVTYVREDSLDLVDAVVRDIVEVDDGKDNDDVNKNAMAESGSNVNNEDDDEILIVGENKVEDGVAEFSTAAAAISKALAEGSVDNGDEDTSATSTSAGSTTSTTTTTTTNETTTSKSPQPPKLSFAEIVAGKKPPPPVPSKSDKKKEDEEKENLISL